MRRRHIGTAQRVTRGRRFVKRLALASLAVASLIASASPAAASVTLGQLGNPPNPTGCSSGYDWVQPTATSGNSYASPATGTITSWSTNAIAGGGQMLAMKVFRKIADPATYMVVGHDGPRPLTASTLNTFPASIPVQAGDLVGLSTAAGTTACDFSVPGETEYYHLGNLAEGASGSFTGYSDKRLNVTAVLVPTNAFTLGGTARNRKKGTATLTVNVPNPGELALSGNGVKTAAAGAVVAKTVTAPGDVELLIKAKGKKKRKLNQTGKVKVKPDVTYTPTGGDPSTQSKKLKLKKR